MKHFQPGWSKAYCFLFKQNVLVHGVGSHPTIKIIWCKLMFWATTCLSPWNVNKNLPHNKSWDKIKQTQYLLAKKRRRFSKCSPLPFVYFFFHVWSHWTKPSYCFLDVECENVAGVLGHSEYWIQYFYYLTQSLVRIPSINSYVFMTVIFYWNIFELLKSLPSLSVLLRNSFVFSSNFKWDPLRIKSTS